MCFSLYAQSIAHILKLPSPLTQTVLWYPVCEFDNMLYRANKKESPHANKKNVTETEFYFSAGNESCRVKEIRRISF